MTCFIPLTKVNTIGQKTVAVNPAYITCLKECPDKLWHDGYDEQRGATLVEMTNTNFYVKERMVPILNLIQHMENEAERYSGWAGKFVDELVVTAMEADNESQGS